MQATLQTPICGFGTFWLFWQFCIFFAKIQKNSRQALCFHRYRPWVGSVSPKKYIETKCSKLDPQKELIDPKMAIKVPKVPTESFFLHCLSQMSPNKWIITKKFKSETLHPKRVPFHPLGSFDPSRWVSCICSFKLRSNSSRAALKPPF